MTWDDIANQNVIDWFYVLLLAALAIWWVFYLIFGRRPGAPMWIEPEHRRKDDGKDLDVYSYHEDDGAPDEPRGRVWDDHEREIMAARNRVRKLRLVK
jgi:hypothetical protein